MPRSSAQQPDPAASAPAIIAGRGRRRAALPLLLVLAALAAGAAGPAPEYGPEAEARFLEKCAPGDVTLPAADPCRRLMEWLQAELGYARFLEAAAGGPGAFDLPGMGRLVAAAPPAGRPALR